eukprot:CAMPEP_0172672870 /NCGR_PEP_ID=MMETSP1074-20121228/11806_1 /TAXON_ID=2916 /ORGANISM="Ceratium fusus, Strain PA161109" /LENGTH=94 /DNA_ID=CAMNT_0013490111 /DNA_START=592 /DNA_END=872 /DNA_ORIENTATION=+
MPPVALAATVARSSAYLAAEQHPDLPYMPKHPAVAQVQSPAETLLTAAMDPAVTLVSPPTVAPVMPQTVPDLLHPVAVVSVSMLVTAAAAAAAA